MLGALAPVFLAHLVLDFGADNAPRRGRVAFQAGRVNRFAAAGTSAVTPLLAAERCFDAHQRHLYPLLMAVRRGLLLQGAHPREPTDAALVQLNRGGGSVPRLLQGEDLFPGLKKPRLEMSYSCDTLLIPCSTLAQRNSNSGTLVLRITLAVVLPTRKRRMREWP